MTTSFVISKDKFHDLLENEDEYYIVGEEEEESKHRWVTLYSRVMRRHSDGSYWRFLYEAGNTEYCDSSDEVQAVEVKPYTTVVTKYKEKNK